MEEESGGCLEMGRREWAPTAGHRNGPDSWDRDMPERTGHGVFISSSFSSHLDSPGKAMQE